MQKNGHFRHRESENFIPLKSYMDFSVIYYIKRSVVALFSVKPMFSVNLMSVKVMYHCIWKKPGKIHRSIKTWGFSKRRFIFSFFPIKMLDLPMFESRLAKYLFLTVFLPKSAHYCTQVQTFKTLVLSVWGKKLNDSGTQQSWTKFERNLREV